MNDTSNPSHRGNSGSTPKTTAPSAHALRTAQLDRSRKISFAVTPTIGDCKTLAEDLGLISVKKLRFTGDLRPAGKADWLLIGALGATVEQPCSVTLEPVRTRIDTQVTRLFEENLTKIRPVEGQEIEIDAGEEIEPLGEWLDPYAVLIEALSLALPDYPRKDHVTLEDAAPSLTDTALSDPAEEKENPFTALADLKRQLESDDDR